jgi:pilus assembly protein CpaC
MHAPRLAALAVATLALVPTPQVARAEGAAPGSGRSAATSGSLALEVGGGRVFRTGGTIANLFAADPKVAEVRPASPNSVFVFGVGAGRTTVAALDEAGNVLGQYDVIVRPSSFGAMEAGAAARRAAPGSDVQFTATPEGITAGGRVPTAAAAERVAAAAHGYLGDKQVLDNRTSITSSVQVTLRVRIAEISRNITRQLGVNWTALANFGRWGIAAALTDGLSQSTNLPAVVAGRYSDGTTSINTVLDMLAQDKLITMLAEPNLTARSGETASFLAGGEFPIPISQQNNTITVQFKQYGVSLAFVPTVLSDGRISLHVRPEVSELSDQGAVSLPVSSGLFGTNTITIPAITVRRADTTVELGSGQSFAVAGLLAGQTTMTARGLPWFGEIPVIGALFKSDLFQRGQSELVIVVTPYIVKPVSSPGELRVPTDGFVPAGDAGRLLLMRQRAVGTDPETVIAPSKAAMESAARPLAALLPDGAGFMLH